MRPIPAELLTGPFHRSRALACGVTARRLEGPGFVRLFPRVYRHREHRMSDRDWREAATLTLPGHAQLTGISRLQQLGLPFGARFPVRFVVEGDLHLDIPEIFLHRTKRMPPTDDVGVTPAAAFISYCRRARVLDAIKVGDWLLHEGHMTTAEVRDLALGERWRDGAEEALWVLPVLDADSRSLKESEVRALLEFAGLPRPSSNRRLPVAEDLVLIGDLVYRQWRTVVEYEGAQHQSDRGQYLSDLDRYAVMRRHALGYVQVTNEKLAFPRTMVGEVYRELLSRGYSGPPPTFEDRWATLFVRIHDLIPPRRDRTRAVS